MRLVRSVAAENKDVLLVRFSASPCDVDELTLLIEGFVSKARKRAAEKKPCGCGKAKLGG